MLSATSSQHRLFAAVANPARTDLKRPRATEVVVSSPAASSNSGSGAQSATNNNDAAASLVSPAEAIASPPRFLFRDPPANGGDVFDVDGFPTMLATPDHGRPETPRSCQKSANQTFIDEGIILEAGEAEKEEAQAEDAAELDADLDAL